MTIKELSQTVILLRDMAKLHRPNEEILTDIKAESFVFVMESVLSALSVPEKGKWIEHEDGDDFYYKCSCCGDEFFLIDGIPDDNHYNFCPNCGADLRGGKE